VIADVISIAAIGVDVCRVFAPTGGTWRVICPSAVRLAAGGVHVVLQSFLLSACYSG